MDLALLKGCTFSLHHVWYINVSWLPPFLAPAYLIVSYILIGYFVHCLKCQVICFTYCVLQVSYSASPLGLFTCRVPAVSWQRVESTPYLPLHHTLSFIHLHSATLHKLVMQPKENRKDTAGGRSDAILTSNWKPSHSLFPIKRPCQAREYERDRVRDEGKDIGEREANWESWSENGTQRERESENVKDGGRK